MQEIINASLRGVISSRGKNRSRTILAILSIALAVGALTVLLSLGDGMRELISDNLEELHPDILWVSTGGQIDSLRYPANITKDQIKKVENISDISVVSPRRIAYTLINGTNFTLDKATVIGAEIDRERLLVKISQGRWLERNNEVVVGKRLANDAGLRVGDNIQINGIGFNIVGVHERAVPVYPDVEYAEFPIINAPRTDLNIVFITYGDAVTIFGERIDQLIVKIGNPNNAYDIAQKVWDAVRWSWPRPEIGAYGEVFAKVDLIAIDFLKKKIDVIEFILFSMALLGFAIASLNIYSTVHSMILENTKDIGIMKAIGAANKHVYLYFLFWVITIGIIGTIMGWLFGKLGILALQQFAPFNVYYLITWRIYLISLGISLLICVTAPLKPMLKATKAQPAEVFGWLSGYELR